MRAILFFSPIFFFFSRFLLTGCFLLSGSHSEQLFLALSDLQAQPGEASACTNVVKNAAKTVQTSFELLRCKGNSILCGVFIFNFSTCFVALILLRTLKSQKGYTSIYST